MKRFSNSALTVVLSVGALLLSSCKDNPEVRTYIVNAAPSPAEKAPSAEPLPVSPQGGPSLPKAMSADALPGLTEAAQSAPALSWKAPAHWQAKQGNAVRRGSWSVPSRTGHEPLDVSVTSFPGDVGGLAANVNRWRGEVGLAALADASASALARPLMLGAVQVFVVELPSAPADTVPLESAKQATLAAIVPSGGATWFFKMRGNGADLATEKAAFIQFIQSIEFPR